MDGALVDAGFRLRGPSAKDAVYATQTPLTWPPLRAHTATLVSACAAFRTKCATVPERASHDLKRTIWVSVGRSGAARSLGLTATLLGFGRNLLTADMAGLGRMMVVVGGREAVAVRMGKLEMRSGARPLKFVENTGSV